MSTEYFFVKRAGDDLLDPVAMDLDELKEFVGEGETPLTVSLDDGWTMVTDPEGNCVSLNVDDDGVWGFCRFGDNDITEIEMVLTAFVERDGWLLVNEHDEEFDNFCGTF